MIGGAHDTWCYIDVSCLRRTVSFVMSLYSECLSFFLRDSRGHQWDTQLGQLDVPANFNLW